MTTPEAGPDACPGGDPRSRLAYRADPLNAAARLANGGDETCPRRVLLVEVTDVSMMRSAHVE